MENEEPVIIKVHPSLADELKIRKEIIEQKLGYKIKGGMPVVSKVVAIELRKRRVHEKGLIQLNVVKRVGEKKVDTFFL